ncbi:MAG: hypothetical protein ACK56I_01075, partial [bacterium]
KQGCVMTTYTDNECNNFTVGLALVGLYKGGLFVFKKNVWFRFNKSGLVRFYKSGLFRFQKNGLSF